MNLGVELADQLVLVLEIAIDGADPDPGPLGQQRGGRTVKAVLGEHLQGRLEQRRSLVFFLHTSSGVNVHSEMYGMPSPPVNGNLPAAPNVVDNPAEKAG